MLVSYCPRGSIAKMDLLGYLKYESHMVISILVIIIQKLPRPCGGYYVVDYTRNIVGI